jgi:hypothetical protein
MAQIILNIPDALVNRVIAGMCGLHNYPTEIQNPDNPDEMIPNPESKADFIKKIIKKRIKKDVLEWEGAEAQRTAYITGETEVDI